MVSSANCWGHKLSHLISGEEHVHQISSPTCRPEEKLWHNTWQTMESSWRRVRRVLYPAIQHIYQEIDNYNLLAPEGLMREIPSCKHNHLDFLPRSNDWDMATIDCCNHLGKTRATFKTFNFFLDFMLILGNVYIIGKKNVHYHLAYLSHNTTNSGFSDTK